MGRAQRGEDRAGMGGAGHPHERPGRSRGGGEPDAGQGRGAGRTLWRGDAARQLRGAAGRSRGRRDLYPAAEPPACRVDREVPRGRQARALREADRAQGRGDRPADRAPRPHRAASRPRPSWSRTIRSGSGRASCVAEGAIGALRQVQGAFTFFNDDPGNIRNRADIGGGALRDIGVYPSISTRFVSGKEPLAVPYAAIEWDRRHRRDRPGGGASSPASGSTSTSRCGWRRGRS